MNRKSQVNYKELNEKKRFCNNDVYHEVSEELNLPTALIQLVADSQSKFTASTMKAGGMESITMVYLGKFKVNPRQVQKMMGKSMRT